MKNETLIVLAALGIGGYVLYRMLQVGRETVDKASGAIADVWLKLFPMPEAIQLLGNVKFPGNILVPLQQIVADRNGGVRKDSAGNVFVRYGGYTWQLAPQVFGNWPATRVS